MSRLIKKLMKVQVFNRQSITQKNIDPVVSNADMDEWKGWDAWVDVRK